MWYVTLNRSNRKVNINKIFPNKSEAYKYLKQEVRRDIDFGGFEIKNASLTLASDEISIGKKIYYKNKKEDIFLGTVEDIGDYLVFMINDSGETSEFTKSTINKRFLEKSIYIK